MENITCHFCYQLCEKPVLLQCNHPICSQCAQTQFSFQLLRKPCENFPLKTEHKQKQGKKIHDEKKTVDIFCPQCNEKTSLIITQGITKLTRDAELAERVKKAHEPMVFMCCEDDGMKAKLYCEDCEENYCRECFERSHSKKFKNHKATDIDGNSPINSSSSSCFRHGHPLVMFCQKDQIPCCYRCFEIGEHMGHESTFVSHIAEKIKKETGEKLTEIDQQINVIKQVLTKMTNLKEQVTLSHEQLKKQVIESFDRVIIQLAKKKEELVEVSKKMEETTLANITLQQEALEDLLKQKTDIVKQTNKWLSGNDLQVSQCKQLLRRNQEIIESMLICCESGKLSTIIDMSPVEQVIDKLVSIINVPVDMKLPTVTGLKEYQQDKRSVTVQWDPVKCDFAEMYFVVQTRADNDDNTVKSIKVLSSVNSFEIPVAENWAQLACTVHCEIDEQFQGEKSAPLIIDLFGNPHGILLHLKGKCSQKIYERVQLVFGQEGIQLDLNSCKIDDAYATALAKVLPHLTQLQELNLSGNQIGHTGAIAIADSISNWTQLQQLYIGFNQIGDIGITAFANSITKFTQLQELWLDNNQFGDIGAIAIANSITNLTQLKVLRLAGNKIGDTGVTAIVNSIKNSTQLQELYLHNNQIGDTGATALANSIANLKQLNCLSLDSNQIGDTGAISIANSIKILTQLQQLDLSSNRIRDRGATALAKSISSLAQLQELYLQDNYCNELVKQHLKQKFGKKLRIYSNNH